MDETIESILQQELDGQNTESDSARLLEAMASDSALKSQYDDYKSLASAIEKIPQLEPSSDFTSNVMAALPKPQAARVQLPRFSLFDFLMGPRLRLVYASVAGMLVATAVTLSLVSGPVTSTAGTMAGANPFQVVEAGGVSVQAFNPGDALVLTFRGSAELAFGYPAETQAAVSGISWSDPGVSTVSEPGLLTVTNRGGGRVSITFQASAGASIQISAAGQVVATIELPVE